MAAQYVRFMRGNSQAFKLLTNKDNDTLYFIYDNNEEGRLYLGDRLIAGGEAGATSLANLKDVLITEGIMDGSLLVYENGAWINKSLDDVISVFIGSTADSDGLMGLVPAPPKSDKPMFLRNDGQWAVIEVGGELRINEDVFVQHSDGTLDLVGFTDAKSGAQLQKGADGTLQWVVPDTTTVEGLSGAVAGLRQDIDNLVDNTYTKEETLIVVNEAIADSAHLKRKIVSSIEEAQDYVNNNADAAEYIFMVPTEGEGPNHYDEYMVIVVDENTKSLQKVGSWEVNLDGYVTDEDLLLLLEDKVDKVEGARLITDAETTKLNDLLLIKSIDNTLNLNSTNGQLRVNSIAISQVRDLSAELLKKADADRVNELEVDVDDLKSRLTWEELT